MLGHTLEAIAGEKAGIIKPGRPVVIGRLPPEAEAVVRAVAVARGSRLVSVREEFGEDIARYPETNLEGDYQRWNAATAILAARLLPARLVPTPGAIEPALRSVVWPGRWQRIALGDRAAILDASHNEEGARALESNLERLRRENPHPPVGVVGVLGASRARPLLDVVCRYCRELYLVVPKQSRALSHQELEAVLPESFRGKTFRSTVEELFPVPGTSTAGNPGDTVVVTGSIYLLGEVLARLEPERGPGEGRLQDF